MSTWTVASCGAEPIHAATVERFVETFGPQGFRRTSFAPAYGLAEATLLVTMKQTGAEPTFLTIEAEALANSIVKESSASKRDSDIGRGTPSDSRTHCKSNDRSSCQAGEVGEVWLAGDDAIDWGKPEESDATFKATLAGQRSPYTN